MKNRKSILNRAAVLIIASLMILSTYAVTANIVKEHEPETDLVGLEASSEKEQTPSQFDDVWLHYDTGKPESRWGSALSYPSHDSIVLTPGMLAPYDGWSVREVAFYHYADPGSEPHNTNVIIYESDNTVSPGATLITEAFVANGTGWQYFILSEPVLIDASKYLWISVEIFHAPNEYPIYADASVSYPGLSDKYYYPLYNWQNLSDFGFNQSWLLRARVAQEPVFEVNISGGSGVTTNIKNIGDSEATNVDVTIKLEGGLIIFGKEKTMNIPSIAVGDTGEAKSFVIGIGKPMITVTVTCDEGVTAEKTASGFVLLFFVINVT